MMKKSFKKQLSVCLPKHVSPVRYSILLHPDLEAHTFSGEETIALSLDKAVREITLHSLDLEIMSAKISFGRETLEADAISYDEKAETATFYFSKQVPKGKAKLKLAWTGVLGESMRGFYKSRYTVDGQERFMATTQFEATDARRCLPCFDEPAQKAVFDVSLVVADGKTAISNTLPVATREHGAGFKVVSFAPTPKMSTYLLAFIVGDFESVETKTRSGVLIRVLTVPGKSHQTAFSLDTAARCLEFYEEYFGIKYPLDTLDLIAIPDFTSAAMENWGAVTFRESELLVDKEHTSAATRQRIAIVITHELAHQWFGNLVTMEWWTHLWLNEGFATYIEHVAVEHLFPEFKIWNQFVIGSTGHGLSGALRLDSLASTHPIEVDVHHPNEIGEIFDEVSYSKGASVIRMLAEYIGEKNFRTGLRHYLKTHSYKNTETEDLWNSFEKSSKLPVRKMMQKWVRTPGYPLVSVEREGANYQLAQTRFFASPVSERKDAGAQTWMIPLSLVTESGVSKPFPLDKKKLSLAAGKEGWMKLNAGETGVFRTVYSHELLDALREPIADGKLSPVDRLGVIRDLFALAEAGKETAVAALSLLSAYRGEQEYIVWSEIVSGLAKVNQIFADTPFAKTLEAYSLAVVREKAEAVGWEKTAGESDDVGFLRSILLSAAGRYGHAGTIETARKLFRERNMTAIHPDLRGVVYSLVAQHGGEKEWNEFVGMHKAATLHEEKNRIERVLGYFSSKKLIEKTLAFSLSKDVRSQDMPFVLIMVLVNPAGRELAWNFIRKNWEVLFRRYSEGHMLPYIVSSLGFFTDKKYAKEIKDFFKKNPAPGAARTLQQVDEKILLNDAWKRRDAKKLEKWLSSLK